MFCRNDIALARLTIHLRSHAYMRWNGCDCREDRFAYQQVTEIYITRHGSLILSLHNIYFMFSMQSMSSRTLEQLRT